MEANRIINTEERLAKMSIFFILLGGSTGESAMKIINAQFGLLLGSIMLCLGSTSSIARKDREPSKNLLSSIHEMDVRQGDTLIDKKKKKYIVRGFDTNGLIDTDRGWVRSLAKFAIAKGQSGGLRVGDYVYDKNGNTGTILGFYIDNTVAWTGPKMRLKPSKLQKIRKSVLPGLMADEEPEMMSKNQF